MEAQSSPVAATPTQEEIRARWAWSEPSVWTDRMLAALENGVKGGSGVDGQTVQEYAKRLETELGIPAVRDRVAQGALRHVLEPVFERIFAEHSYGFRPGRGCKDALRRVDALLKGGRTWVVDADLNGYFDTIPHDRLMALVEEQIADGRGLALIRGYLKQGVMDGLKEWEPESGTPQGAVVSPLLANLYLTPLDLLMAGKGFEMVRYADDFLGYHFERGHHWPRKKSLTRFRDGIRDLTRRANGKSMDEIIARLNSKLRGWYGYFNATECQSLYNGAIINWRAGCGKSASPVRREG